MCSAAEPVKTLPLNEIQVGGWMKNQILRDITTGYISVYDKIQPTLMRNLFGPVKAKNQPSENKGVWNTRLETWWPGEHEGYFADVVVRSAFLTSYQPWLEKAKKIMDNVIENQDTSGYIGIYTPECRLDSLVKENGEFWSQSRMLNAMLAYYEYTGDKRYFDAAKKAIDYDIYRYTKSGKSYFNIPNPNGGGLTHGLMIVETLEWFYKLTHDKKYLNFAEWLYKDYSAAGDRIGNSDNQLANLLDRELMYKEHAVHICESLRVPFFLASNTENSLYKEASDNALYKIKRSLNPSGSIATDKTKHESVAYNYGSADLPVEYCTITELIVSFGSAFQKRVEAKFGDMIESLAFNAAQGARLPDGSAIVYSSTDNQKDALFKNNFRYQYAACHSVACCNLQASKALPIYISNMWMKSVDEKSIYAVTFGESEVNTQVNGTLVQIKENTAYPFENRIKFSVNPSKKVKFEFILRNPYWSKNTKIEANGAIVKQVDDFIYLNKEWQTGDEVIVTFESKIMAHKTMSNDFYISRGALIYTLPIADKRLTTEKFMNGLKNMDIFPSNEQEADEIFTNYKVEPNLDFLTKAGKSKLTFIINPEADIIFPFDKPFGFIEGNFFDKNQPVKVQLVPLGASVLRKTSFPSFKK